MGSLLLFTTIENRVNPANLLQASSPTEQLGMDGMAVIMAVVATWLVISGIRPVWRKITN